MLLLKETKSEITEYCERDALCNNSFKDKVPCIFQGEKDAQSESKEGTVEEVERGEHQRETIR